MAEQQSIHRVTALFRNVPDAAAAYYWARHRFDDTHVSVLVSEKSKDAFHEAVQNLYQERSRDSTPEAEGTAATGVLLGAGLFALAGLAISGLGLFAVGPLAAALAGGTVGAMVGPIVGGLIGYGFPEDSAKAYEQLLLQGATAVGIMTHDEQQVQIVSDHFKQLNGEQLIVI